MRGRPRREGASSLGLPGLACPPRGPGRGIWARPKHGQFKHFLSGSIKEGIPDALVDVVRNVPVEDGADHHAEERDDDDRVDQREPVNLNEVENGKRLLSA